MSATKKFKKGAIYKIELKKFMCYKNFEFYPGPGFNVILGPNGSGKSSISVAIVIGTGGELKILNRQTHLRELVLRDGKRDDAVIRIQMMEEDQSPDSLTIVSGDFYTIECRITREGSVSYKLNDVSIPKMRLRNLLKSHIKFDPTNISQVLAQDTVRKFPDLTPKDLFKVCMSTIDETNPQKELDEMNKMTTEYKALDEKLNRQSEALKAVQARYKEVCNLEEQMKQTKEIEEKIALFRNQEMALEVSKLKTKIKRSESQMREKSKSMEGAEKLVEETKKALSAFNEKETDLQKMCTEGKRAKLKFELESAAPKFKEIEAKIKRLDKNIKETEANTESKKKVIIAKIKELETQRSLIDVSAQKSLLEETKDSKATHETRSQRLADDMEVEKEHMADSNRKLDDLRNQLERLQSAEDRKLKILQKKNLDAYRAVMWLRSNKAMIGFKAPDKVYEPLFLNLSITKPEYARQLESCISAKEMDVFIAEEVDDVNLLIKVLRKEYKWEKISVAHARSQDVHRFKKPQWKSDPLLKNYPMVFLDETFECPAAIRAHLLNKKKLHLTPVFKEDPPGKFGDGFIKHYFVGTESYRYISSFYDSDPVLEWSEVEEHPNGFLNANNEDVDEEMSIVEANILKREKICKEISERQIQLLEKFEVEKRHSSNSSSELKRITHVINTARALDSEIEREKFTLKIFDSKQKRNNFEAYQNERDDLVKMLPEAQKAFDDLKSETNEKVKNAEEAEELLKKLHEDFAEQKSEHNKARAKLLELKNEIAAISETNKTLKKEFGEKVVQLPWFRKGDKSLEMPPEMKAKLAEAECKNKLYDVQAEIGILQHNLEAIALTPREVQNYRTVKKIWLEKSEEFEKLKRERDQKHSEVVNGEKALSELINNFAAKINTKFSKLMADIEFSGEVVLHRGTGELDLKNYGLQMMVKFRNRDPFQPLKSQIQSGGEKSVATALFIMALQALTPFVPIRVVDEINQGMDFRNETEVWKILMEEATKTSTQFFFIAQKFPKNLQFGEDIKFHICMNGPKLTIPAGRKVKESSFGDIAREMQGNW